MRPRRDYVVRPLLCVSRSEIEQWLDSQGQDYVVDSTNLQQDVVRNKIRLGVVPELLKVSPQASAAILHTAEQLRQTQLLADKYADEALLRLVDNDAVCIAALIQEPSPELLLYYWLTRYGFTPSVVRQIAERLPVARTGNCWTSATHEVCVDRGRLLVSPIITPFKPMRIPEAGTYVLCDGSKMTIATSQDVSISHHRLVACLDADRVSFPLTIRRITEGDRMTPLGMKGTRLVSDMLTDAKMPMTAKKRQLAVCDSKGLIVWLPGVRPANDCRITPETATMLRIEIVESTETHEG
jgi:tRNA(Ile)-lysidine synthase